MDTFLLALRLTSHVIMDTLDLVQEPGFVKVMNGGIENTTTCDEGFKINIFSDQNLLQIF